MTIPGACCPCQAGENPQSLRGAASHAVLPAGLSALRCRGGSRTRSGMCFLARRAPESIRCKFANEPAPAWPRPARPRPSIVALPSVRSLGRALNRCSALFLDLDLPIKSNVAQRTSAKPGAIHLQDTPSHRISIKIQLTKPSTLAQTLYLLAFGHDYRFPFLYLEVMGESSFEIST